MEDEVWFYRVEPQWSERIVSTGLYIVKQFEKLKEEQGIQKHKHERCVEHTPNQMDASVYKVGF